MAFFTFLLCRSHRNYVADWGWGGGVSLNESIFGEWKRLTVHWQFCSWQYVLIVKWLDSYAELVFESL